VVDSCRFMTTEPPALVQFCRGIFFQGTWHTLSSEAKVRDASVDSAFFSVSLLVYGDYHHNSCQSLASFQNTRPRETLDSAKELLP